MGLEMRDADAMIHSNTGELGAKLAASQNNGTLTGDHLYRLTNLILRQKNVHHICRSQDLPVDRLGNSLTPLQLQTPVALSAVPLVVNGLRGPHALGVVMSCQILDEQALP